MRIQKNSKSIVCCFMTCVAGALFFLMSQQAEAQVTYTFSGIANNLFGDSENPFVGVNEPYTATFVVDQSVVDSDPSSLRGFYVGAIVSSTIEFDSGYTSLVDFAGGDVIVHEANPGGGLSFDAPGEFTGGIILYQADNIPFESDSLFVDPGVIPMQTGFWYLAEPDGQINSFSELESGEPMAMKITFEKAPLLGDVDQSGAIDFSDIGPFIELLSGGLFQAEADCDNSGQVDFDDISAFIEILAAS